MLFREATVRSSMKRRARVETAVKCTEDPQVLPREASVTIRAHTGKIQTMICRAIVLWKSNVEFLPLLVGEKLESTNFIDALNCDISIPVKSL